MLASAWVRFGLFLMALALLAAQALPARRGEPQAFGQALVAQYRLGPDALERYAALAAGTALDEPRRENSRFVDEAPWVGPWQPVGIGRNPYTLVLTVSGAATAQGRVSAQWQGGWNVLESALVREVVLDLPDLSTTVAAVTEPVTLTASSGRVSFRGERTAAPKLGLVSARNLKIQDVQLQVWSGVAPLAWPLLPTACIMLLALGAASLGFGILVRRSGSGSGSTGVPVAPVNQRCNRTELATTSSELAAMPSPAAHGGSAPSSASGTQTAL